MLLRSRPQIIIQICVNTQVILMIPVTSNIFRILRNIYVYPVSLYVIREAGSMLQIWGHIAKSLQFFIQTQLLNTSTFGIWELYGNDAFIFRHSLVGGQDFAEIYGGCEATFCLLFVSQSQKFLARATTKQNIRWGFQGSLDDNH